MADRVLPGPAESTACQTGCINIHTNKIFDCCRDKDCIEDLRVYLTQSSQAVVNSALSVRPSSAELIYANVSVDEISFNRGYYTVDVTFFYAVKGSAFPGGGEVRGLAVFDKRVILYGSEGTSKVFSSEGGIAAPPAREMPVAYVEAVDPIALSMRIADADTSCVCDGDNHVIPESIAHMFSEPLSAEPGGRRLYVTLGQFSMIRLERETQITLDRVCYFFPSKECAGSSSEDDPCTLFSRVRFPMEEFFPPDAASSCDCCDK